MAGCASSLPLPSGGAALEFPPAAPRVRLERIISARSDLGRRSFRAWLGGERDEALFARPYAAAWLEDTLLVADPGARRVVSIAADGRTLTSPPELLAGPAGVAPCLGGIVVSDSIAGRVALLDRDLHFTRWLATELLRPTGVTCSGNGLVVVETAAHRVVVLAADGARRVIGRRGSAPGEFNFSAAIAGAGTMWWVGDTLNFRLQEIDAATGECRRSFGALGDAQGETPRIKGIALDAAGHLWVSDGYLDQVAVFTPGGDWLMSLGRKGDAPGEFSFPAGIAAHADGRVAVVDSLNRRVQVFRLVDGEGSHHAGP